MKNNYEGKIVAIVDDDPDSVSTVSDYLESCGFSVKGFLEAESLLRYLDTETPDIIILDIILPDMNGFQICKNLRDMERFENTPIIILSGQGKDTDKVFGLDLGADDYMIKPYSLDELVARIRAALRRRSIDTGDKIIKLKNGIVIDQRKYIVTIDGKNAGLTPTEFNILALFASRKEQVFTRENILNHLWGDEKVVIDRTIDVHIRHLRDKLGDAGSCIKMVRGVGYKLEED